MKIATEVKTFVKTGNSFWYILNGWTVKVVPTGNPQKDPMAPCLDKDGISGFSLLKNDGSFLILQLRGSP